MRVFILTLLLALVTSLPMTATAHGEDPPPAPEGWNASRLTWPGSAEFMHALAQMGSGILSSDSSTFDAALQHFRFSHVAAQMGRPPADIQFHLMSGEALLAELLAFSPRVHSFDFTGPVPKTPPAGTLSEAGATGIVLFCIVMPGEGIEFRRHTHDLRSQWETVRAISLDVATSGTTYLLLELVDPLVGESWHHFSIKPDGAAEAIYFDGIKLNVPEKGLLSVDITADSGDSDWFLVSVTSLSTGRIMRPAGSLNLSRIMDEIAGPAPPPLQSYHYFAPGPGAGPYWVNAGEFDMSLDPGDYEVRARKGHEYTPVQSIQTVKSGETTRCEIRLTRWIDMPALGWYSGDDHVHAQLLHSEDAEQLMAFTKASDVHVVNLLEMGNDRRTFYEQRGFGPDAWVRSGNHVIVPGQEDPRYQFGHAVGLNMKTRVRDLKMYALNDLWVDALHEQDALYGHAHVGHKAFGIMRDMTLLIPMEKSDFSTILQGFLDTEYYYDFLDLGYRQPASAGTDAPYGGAGIGNVRVYCQTAGEKLDVQAWFDALEEGRSFVTQGPMLFLDVEGRGPGSRIRATRGQKFTVLLRAMGEPAAFSPAEVSLVYNSNVVSRQMSEAESPEVRLAFDLDAGTGGWLAARVRDAHGSEAHTSPVYIEVEGFRPWNHERAPALIAARRATLDDIEGLILEIEQKESAGDLWILDFWSRRVLENAPALRERLAAVRGRMDELESIHKAETSLRQGGTSN